MSKAEFAGSRVLAGTLIPGDVRSERQQRLDAGRDTGDDVRFAEVAGVGEHGEPGLPPELRRHEGEIPMPDMRHHQDRWCGKVRQRTADRNIDEQQSNCRVTQLR